MTARVGIAERALSVIAVGLGLGHAAFLGGFATPVPFTRAVLAVGVLCPLMMGQSSARIGNVVLRPQARLLPLLVSLGLGPALAVALGRTLLQSHPEQAAALLLLSVLPGSSLVPVWVSHTGASRSTAVALALIGWTIATFVSLPLLVGSHAPVARLVAFRELAFLGVMPLAVGGIFRTALANVFEAEDYVVSVEPIRQAVLQASLAVLLFTSAATKECAHIIREAAVSLPAFAAVVLLYLGLMACGSLLLAFRRGLSMTTASATLQVTVTRQTALATSLLPLMVAPADLPNAAAVPVFALVLELVFGAVALALYGAWPRGTRASRVEAADARPSIVPE